ncbi:MAG: hypothetical protein NTU44_00485 [Bacteroidetes bacterium]|nr:hypothetical protein [Bacteroidota bacterium]
MTRIVLIVILSLSSLWAFTQDPQPNDKYNCDKNCNTGGQQDMNFCLSKAQEKLSKIMQIKYECLIGFFDAKINYFARKDSLIASDYLRMKKRIISSQFTWEKLKKENADFYKDGGGTITPMLIIQSLIKDLKDRLKWLDDVIEELGQGDESEVLKCE